MPERIHLVLDPADKERFRAAAVREGKTLSAWLRDAAEERVATAERERGSLATPEDLEAFFRACDEREPGREPDWEAHQKVIERSLRSGEADS